MAEIHAGQIVVFYLFDVAESIDLKAIPSLIGGPTVAARLEPKPATPVYVQYETPPVSFDGEAVGLSLVQGFRARVRLYDYGVLSLALSRPIDGRWADLLAVGPGLIENAELEAAAHAISLNLAARFRPAFEGYRDAHLSEDYVVFLVNELDTPRSADALLAEHGTTIAMLLRGERQPLSEQERTVVLQQRLSYLADDLVIPTWNAAFIYDTPAGSRAALEILEFANSQLLQFRYYDERLDHELAAIYATLQRPRWYDQWIGSHYAKAARHVHALIVDVMEVTDRTVNALKFTGDVYAARLFSLVAERLGLGTWRANVDGKLRTLDTMYRFAVEQSSMARGQLLEFTIVLILVLEFSMLLAGLRH
ncbi:MAG: hypothetical protein AB7N65_07670 [Vicinamibacterales bacterium]